MVEAGSYENGRREDPIRVYPRRSFQRFDFDVYVKGDKNPEIRVYNIAGDSAAMRVQGDESDDRDDRWYGDRYPDRRDDRYRDDRYRDDYRDEEFRW